MHLYLTGKICACSSRFAYALRQLRNSPGFAVTAILTLALGIGATTAIFSILDAVLLQPLPFPHPDRLVAIAVLPDEIVSTPTIHDWQTRGHSFQSIAGYRGWSPTVQSSLGSQVGNVLEVTQNFFSTLGTGFALGQDFPQTGNERDCTAQVIVSGAFWKRLGGGSSLGNRTLVMDRRTYQITGVLPLVADPSKARSRSTNRRSSSPPAAIPGSAPLTAAPTATGPSAACAPAFPSRKPPPTSPACMPRCATISPMTTTAP